MSQTDTSFLLDYNIKTYNKIHEILAKENSCAVVQPTGTGKSYIMMALLQDYKDMWKIVIAPSRDFLDNLESNEHWTSEKTLTLTYSYIGINCDEITQALVMHKIHPSQVGLIIIDEMHRAGAPKWGAGVKNLIEICKNAKTVGLTATPKRYDEGRNMVTELFNDRLAQNMNLADAIGLGIIPQLSYVVGMHTLGINIDEVVRTIPSDIQYNYIRKKFQTYKDKWNFETYFIDTLSKYIDINEKSGKHIVFASSIEEAKKIAPLVNSWFKKMFKDSKVKTFCIHSKSSTKSEDIAKFFKENKSNEVKIAVAVDMLNESFHCDDVKTISMFRGTQSLQVYMQQIGRALSAHGKAPYIFDFVDNFHSIKALEEMITSTSAVTDMQDTDSERPFVFKEFNDETQWFVKDLIKLKQISYLGNEDSYVEILSRLEESDDGTIFGVPDEDFVIWASYILRTNARTKTIKYLNDIDNTAYDRLKFSIDVCESLGASWYKLFRKWDKDNNCLDDKELRKMRSSFSKALVLNQMSEDTIEYFKKHGLYSRITYNKDKLSSLLEVNEPKNFKFKDKLLSFETTINNENHYAIYKDIVLFNANLCEDGDRAWSASMLGDAIAYWLWKLYRATYKKKIDEILKEFSNIQCIEELIARQRKMSFSSISRDSIIDADKLLGKAKTVDELPDNIKQIFKFNSIKSIDKIYETIMLMINLTNQEKVFKDKIKYQLTLEKMDSDLLEYVIRLREGFNDAIKSNGYSWSFRIMNKYRELVKIADGMEAYIKDEKTSETEWFWKYAEDVKRDYIESKTPKAQKSKVAANNKLAIALDMYNTYESIESEIKSEYVNNFKEVFKTTHYEWERTYGDADKAIFLIGIVALGRCKASHELSSSSNVSAKLIRSITVFFDWIKESDKFKDDTIIPNEVILVRKAIELLGNDTIYLFDLALSKTNREPYLSMFTLYKKTSKIVSSVCASIVMDCSDRDNQLIQAVDSSKLVEKYAPDLFEFNNIIVEEYDKFMR